ncbi:hypothetical protein P8452_00116 [Trifolium repens]|nr:hypothetical protein P8452_00116 [Trifolium repens]
MFNMVSPAVGEGGSSDGSSNPPVHIDLNLPSFRDEIYDLVAELEKVEKKVSHLSETLVQSVEGLEANQKQVEHLKTVLDGLETRLD